MIVRALKTLTWGTIASAVISAVLLAFTGNGPPDRFVDPDTGTARDRLARPARAESPGTPPRQSGRANGGLEPPRRAASR